MDQAEELIISIECAPDADLDAIVRSLDSDIRALPDVQDLEIRKDESRSDLPIAVQYISLFVSVAALGVSTVDVGHRLKVKDHIARIITGIRSRLGGIKAASALTGEKEEQLISPDDGG
jgi:hypothetical protein